jgi:hypothetical protein
VPVARGQPGLGSSRGRASALLVAARDGRAGRRIQIKPDGIPEFGFDLRIVVEFKSPSAVRFEVVGRQNPLHRRTR